MATSESRRISDVVRNGIKNILDAAVEEGLSLEDEVDLIDSIVRDLKARRESAKIEAEEKRKSSALMRTK